MWQLHATEHQQSQEVENEPWQEGADWQQQEAEHVAWLGQEATTEGDLVLLEDPAYVEDDGGQQEANASGNQGDEEIEEDQEVDPEN